MTTYIVLGGALGGVGGTAYALAWSTLQRPLYIVANILLLGLAIALARGTSAPAPFETAGLSAFRRLLPAVRKLASRQRTVPTRFGLGLLWGATPCALVYGVLPVALMSGSAADGALVMAAFGLGTLPNLLGANLLLTRFRQTFRASGWRIGAGILVSAFALYGIYRALFLSSSLGQSPYCLPG